MDRRIAEGTRTRLHCVRLASDGTGIGYDEQGIVTFVPGLLPNEEGEIIITERKKTWQRARLLELIMESPQRVKAPCQVFEICGGCQLQHTTYEQTLVWKAQWVKDALKRVGKIEAEVLPTVGMDSPWRYRNKARLHREASGMIGYYRERSNHVVRFPDCLLLSQKMNRWIKETEALLGKECPEVETLIFRENTRQEGLLLLERLAKLHYKDKYIPMVKRLVDKLEPLGLTSLWGRPDDEQVQRLWGEEELRENILGLQFQLSPLAFLQVNPVQTRTLYSLALEMADLKGEETVWDLYSGIGTITLALARVSNKVWGIEENPFAVEDAMNNACLNGLNNVTFQQGRVEDVISSLEEEPQVVVMDPPRSGAHRRVVEALIRANPRRIVYVSCDPGTLARDVGIFVQRGYNVERVQPVDMFPWTAHVETVVLIERK